MATSTPVKTPNPKTQPSSVLRPRTAAPPPQPHPIDHAASVSAAAAACRSSSRGSRPTTGSKRRRWRSGEAPDPGDRGRRWPIGRQELAPGGAPRVPLQRPRGGDGHAEALVLQMVHDPSALEPRCRFQDEDSEEYGNPLVSSSAIADLIRSRTDSHLRKIQAAVSSKPIVMRAEYAHCPNLTIIDTPGFVLKAKKGEPEDTPNEILSMVKSLAGRPSASSLPPAEQCGVVFFALVGRCSCLRKYLESELQKRYKEAAPATLALLEQRCSEVSLELSQMESKLHATSDVSHLRKSAMLHAASICHHLGVLIDGAADPAPEQWGKTTEEEQKESGIGSWPGVTVAVKPPNCTLRLYGGAAFERVMHEFRCATYSIECPQVSREKVANILLAHAGRGGGGGVTEAAAEIARAAARAWLAPLLDTACDRLAFVLQSLFDLAMERNRVQDLERRQNNRDMDGYIGFLASLRRSYNNFILDLSKQCKQLVRHHLDAVTSPYSHICYENDLLAGIGSSSNSIYRLNQLPTAAYFDLSEGAAAPQIEMQVTNQENIPPKEQQQTPPGKGTESKEVLKESQMTVPETPSPDQPNDPYVANKKENVEKGCSWRGLGFVRGERRKVHGHVRGARAIDVLQSEYQSLHKRQKILQSCLSEFKNISRALTKYPTVESVQIPTHNPPPPTHRRLRLPPPPPPRAPAPTMAPWPFLTLRPRRGRSRPRPPPPSSKPTLLLQAGRPDAHRIPVLIGAAAAASLRRPRRRGPEEARVQALRAPRRRRPQEPQDDRPPPRARAPEPNPNPSPNPSSPWGQSDVPSPSMLGFRALTLSPVTPLSPDGVFNRSPRPGPPDSFAADAAAAAAAEERAIAEKGFYLHPSPRGAAAAAEPPPRLLPSSR
uniref:Dynamin N-terminal domain-containing protein n=1 Tax=Ananas comosus var. bracteatus TaxID=296719 RepID=A0A6V7NZW5_ANACO|nr:unnamed protein product [Ananas comosus var. bracteatus]